MKKIASIVALSALAAVACSDASSDGADGKGTVTFTTWGEEYIEQEIPASEIEDGYTVKYTKFLVALTDIAVAAMTSASCSGPANSSQPPRCSIPRPMPFHRWVMSRPPRTVQWSTRATSVRR